MTWLRIEGLSAYRYSGVLCEQRLHFRCVSCRAKSYFSHDSSQSENVASARSVTVGGYWNNLISAGRINLILYNF